jgi:hypothetical protein
MLLLILANLIILGITIQVLLVRIKQSDEGIFELKRHRTSSLIGMKISKILMISEYVSLLVGTFIIVGTGTTFYMQIEMISGSLGVADISTDVKNIFWICEVSARLGGGLLAALFLQHFDGYLYAGM